MDLGVFEKIRAKLPDRACSAAGPLLDPYYGSVSATAESENPGSLPGAHAHPGVSQLLCCAKDGASVTLRTFEGADECDATSATRPPIALAPEDCNDGRVPMRCVETNQVWQRARPSTAVQLATGSLFRG
jgi:hypothetical protein